MREEMGMQRLSSTTSVPALPQDSRNTDIQNTKRGGGGSKNVEL